MFELIWIIVPHGCEWLVVLALVMVRVIISRGSSVGGCIEWCCVSWFYLLRVASSIPGVQSAGVVHIARPMKRHCKLCQLLSPPLLLMRVCTCIVLYHCTCGCCPQPFQSTLWALPGLSGIIFHASQGQPTITPADNHGFSTGLDLGGLEAMQEPLQNPLGAPCHCWINMIVVREAFSMLLW